MEALLTNQWIILGSVFASVILASFAILSLVRKDPAHRRFKSAGTGKAAATQSSIQLVQDDHRSPAFEVA